MATKAKLKFKPDLPYVLEHKLCTKYGFRVFSRKKDEWLIVEKLDKAWQPEVLVNGVLPDDIQQILIGRCNKITDMFLDQEAHAYTIKLRLNKIAETLPPQQRKFIHEWIVRNVDGDE